MPILLNDIQVPVIERRNDYGDLQPVCSLCAGVVGHNYNYEPQPHRLDECLYRLLVQSKSEEREP